MNETKKFMDNWLETKEDKMEKDKSLDDQFVKLLEEAKRLGVGEKEFIDNVLKEYKSKLQVTEGDKIKTRTLRITEEFIEKWARKICFSPFPTDDFLIRARKEIRGCLEEAWKLWVRDEDNQMRNQVGVKKEVTEEWIEEKAKELITMVANLYPHEASPCVIPKSNAKDFIRSLVEEIHGRSKD